MSQVYVAGPAEIHVGTGTAGALQFLGWGMQGVRIDFVGHFYDVPSDVAGTDLPFDVQQMGQQAYITSDINVYNEGIYRKIANRTRLTDGGPGSAFGDGPTEGELVDFGMGFLLAGETIPASVGSSGMFGLLVFPPYAGGFGGAKKVAFTTEDQAYRFPVAYLDDAAVMELGSRFKKIRMVFRAITFFSPQVRYSGILYDHNSNGRVGID